MKKNYLLAIGIYIVLQLSGILGIPEGINPTKFTILKFGIATFLIIAVLNNDLIGKSKYKETIKKSLIWAVGGVLIAGIGQYIIESLIDTGVSQNTTDILDRIKVVPMTILLSSLFAPVMEELIFRKIIFRTIQKKAGFMTGALVSSVLFGLIHFDITHLLTYVTVGFIFSFIYARTNRLFVPIVSHVSMNSLIVAFSFLGGIFK